MEQWKQIPDFTDYFISDLGNIKSVKKGATKLLKNSLLNVGYYRVSLSVNDEAIQKLVHRLVAEAFIPNPKNLRCINHKDGNKLNNHVSNLEWVNDRENATHGYKTKSTSSQYPGVHWQSGRSKWVAQIRTTNDRFYLGSFTDEEKAYEAYLSALERLKAQNKYAT